MFVIQNQRNLSCRIFIVIFSLLFFMCCGHRAHSFEAEGYKSGMTIEQTRTVARSLQEISLPGNNDPRFRQFLRQIAPGRNETFQFCDGRLYRFERQYVFSSGTLITLVTEANRSYGPGTYGSRIDILDDGKRAGQLEFFWNLAGINSQMSVRHMWMESSNQNFYGIILPLKIGNS